MEEGQCQFDFNQLLQQVSDKAVFLHCHQPRWKRAAIDSIRRWFYANIEYICLESKEREINRIFTDKFFIELLQFYVVWCRNVKS